MENPTPFDSNAAIRRWQENLGASPAFGAENLEELASHLRASVQRLKAAGLSEEEAFLIATRRIGGSGALEKEFAKVNSAGVSPERVILFWVVGGIYFFELVCSLVFGMRAVSQLMEARQIDRLFSGESAGGSSWLMWMINSTYSLQSLPRYFGPVLSILMGLVVLLGVRFAARSWKGFDAFARVFERPNRTALGLAGLGVVLPFLPAFLLSFGGRMMDSLSTPKPAGLLGLSTSFRGSMMDFLYTPQWATASYATSQVEVNLVLVLGMVLLACRGLRKMPRVDGPLSKCAMSNS